MTKTDLPDFEEALDQPQLDPEVEARRLAALRFVRTFGDPVLRAKALPIENFDDRLREEVERMAAIMSDAIGVGLAATQLGIMHRVFVYRTDPEGEVTPLVNAEILSSSDETEISIEGCLSLPNVTLEIERPAEVRVRAFDVEGKQLEFDAVGLEARVIQHELDHLDGTLIIDHVSGVERKEAMRILRGAPASE